MLETERGKGRGKNKGMEEKIESTLDKHVKGLIRREHATVSHFQSSPLGDANAGTSSGGPDAQSRKFLKEKTCTFVSYVFLIGNLGGGPSRTWLSVMCCSPFYPLGLSKYLSARVGTLLASAE